MIRTRNGKIKIKGSADVIITDFAILCVWFFRRVLIPTFKDKQTAKYKMERIFDDAMRCADKMDKKEDENG